MLSKSIHSIYYFQQAIIQ